MGLERWKIAACVLPSNCELRTGQSCPTAVSPAQHNIMPCIPPPPLHPTTASFTPSTPPAPHPYPSTLSPPLPSHHKVLHPPSHPRSTTTCPSLAVSRVGLWGHAAQAGLGDNGNESSSAPKPLSSPFSAKQTERRPLLTAGPTSRSLSIGPSPGSSSGHGVLSDGSHKGTAPLIPTPQHLHPAGRD